jgi:hypothetical protein
LRVILSREGVPACRIIVLNSRRNISRTASTPGWPNAPSPHASCLPVPTAVAPIATALKMSVPRRIPPSTITGILPATPSITSGKLSIVGRRLSSSRLSQCSDPTLVLAPPHYGLRYGSAPATENFQRLRGRPPLVSPLKSCMGRSFTAVTRVQIPSGTPTLSTT